MIGFKSSKRVAAVAVALGVIGGGVVIAAPAQAHTGDMSVTAECKSDLGVYELTATLTITQTGLTGESMWRVGTGKFDGTPKNANGMDRGPVASSGAGTITLGSFTLPGDTTGMGPWVYAHTKWSDGYTKGSDGQLRQALTGDCEAPEVLWATPLQPTATPGQESCVDGALSVTAGSIILPAFEHGHWNEAPAGILEGIEPGEYAFTATADEGYSLTPNTFEGVDTDMWFVTVPEVVALDAECVPTVVPPVEEPPVETPPTDLPDELVLTGADASTAWLGGGFIVGGLLLGAFAAWRKRVTA